MGRNPVYRFSKLPPVALVGVNSCCLENDKQLNRVVMASLYLYLCQCLRSVMSYHRKSTHHIRGFVHT